MLESKSTTGSNVLMAGVGSADGRYGAVDTRVPSWLAHETAITELCQGTTEEK